MNRQERAKKTMYWNEIYDLYEIQVPREEFLLRPMETLLDHIKRLGPDEVLPLLPAQMKAMDESSSLAA